MAIDFGTSNTVAVLRRDDGPADPLLFDGTPLLPSAVFAQADGSLLTGRDALHSRRVAPERFEPNPKLRVDDGTVLLGAEVPVGALFTAVLRRVADEARRVADGPVRHVVLTHPAGWGPRRRAVLTGAAEQAGLGSPTLLPEPVAAARRLTGPTDTPTVVYDFGGGTFDASVVAGTRVLAADGLPDTGGLDVDAALIAYLEATYRQRDPAAWDRLRDGTTAADRRAWWQFTEDVRVAKEMLSRTAQTFVHVPLIGVDAPIGREQVEAIAAPLVARTVAATRAVLTAAGLAVPPPGPLLLVGGASRMPLVARMIHRRLRTAPTAVEQPELVVAQGALLAAVDTPPAPSPVDVPATVGAGAPPAVDSPVPLPDVAAPAADPPLAPGPTPPVDAPTDHSGSLGTPAIPAGTATFGADPPAGGTPEIGPGSGGQPGVGPGFGGAAPGTGPGFGNSPTGAGPGFGGAAPHTGPGSGDGAGPTPAGDRATARGLRTAWILLAVSPVASTVLWVLIGAGVGPGTVPVPVAVTVAAVLALAVAVTVAVATRWAARYATLLAGVGVWALAWLTGLAPGMPVIAPIGAGIGTVLVAGAATLLGRYLPARLAAGAPYRPALVTAGTALLTVLGTVAVTAAGLLLASLPNEIPGMTLGAAIFVPTAAGTAGALAILYRGARPTTRA
ncbi:hypothetical protein GCM10022220_10960 [Actinocatenispora rupis]|uniref:Hsp70 protein n=2 Tax=Actinocatenispora rupis TaxID=519421 RepID=A0A8J3N8B4_9ACTN|nr:hypothetical protein Aru02nite_07950 [Actinocatenispora rupis]